MTTEKTGTLFIFSGPSGVGKGTLKNRLFTEFGDEIVFSVPATTRAPREGETAGKDYFFVTEEQFQKLIEEDAFLEHAQYASHQYGTPKAFVDEHLYSGRNVLVEIDVQGAGQIKQKRPESVSVFILPPSMEALENRLRGRKTEDEATIQKRLAAAEHEIEESRTFDYRIINDDLDQAYRELREIYLNHASRKVTD